MTQTNWSTEVPFAITVCDTKGIILEMNEKSQITFAKDGGSALIGKNLFGCHSAKDQQKILEMISSTSINVYTIEKDGKKKLIYQCPWYEGGKPGGLVELSLELPEMIPHFVRGSKIIYHITRPEHWQKAQKIGEYLPENFSQDGFMHCSKKEQIPAVGNSYYKGQKGLLVLLISLEKLKSEVKWENTSGGEELFPHIYGALNLEAVTHIADFEPNAAGEFEFPSRWEKV